MRFNKLLGFCLSFTLVFSTPLVASAGIKDIEKNLCKLDTEEHNEEMGYNELVYNLSESFMTNKNCKFRVSEEIIASGNLDNLLVDVLNFNSGKTYNLDSIVDIPYISSSYSYTIGENGYSDYIYYIGVQNTTYNDDMEIDYEDYYSSILKNININSLSDYEKVYYIHNYICDSFDYDDEAASDSKYAPSLSDKSLDTRGFICGNYAVLTKDLLNRAGVPCIIINGTSYEGTPHAWNLVKLSGKWYWMDVTWDDNLDDYSYFLRGSDEFLETHKIGVSYVKSLEKYRISSTDYKSKKLSKPTISGISISSKKIIHVDFKLNSARKCKLYLDGKSISNNSKISVKNGSKIAVKFNDSASTVYRYKVYKISSKYCLLRYA